jgi:ABC-type nitrate/sulfonate/bicarbonate transport system ATPase subunit
VTHDVEEAIGLADRLLVMSASPARIVAEVPIARPRGSHSAEEIAAIRNQVAPRLGQARPP